MTFCFSFRIILGKYHCLLSMIYVLMVLVNSWPKKYWFFSLFMVNSVVGRNYYVLLRILCYFIVWIWGMIPIIKNQAEWLFFFIAWLWKLFKGLVDKFVPSLTVISSCCYVLSCFCVIFGEFSVYDLGTKFNVWK